MNFGERKEIFLLPNMRSGEILSDSKSKGQLYLLNDLHGRPSQILKPNPTVNRELQTQTPEHNLNPLPKP